GRLYFLANDGAHGLELWKSDGTAGGTALVKDINSTADGLQDGSSDLELVNGVLYFGATGGVYGLELWRAGRAEAGTVPVADINAAADSYPFYMTAVGDHIYFNADDGVHGFELWSLQLDVPTITDVQSTSPAEGSPAQITVTATAPPGAVLKHDF